MKIKRILVEDFGKFHQKEFVTGDGLNLVTGGNEYGKTTLRHFLRAMWYGLERERGLRARQDEYTRYKPWHSGRFQGSLEWEADGKVYRLSRNFLTKETSLFCLENGKTIPDPEKFLDSCGRLSEAVYRNTCWTGYECRTEDILAESYKNHMVNFALTGGMNLNLQRADERLKKRQRELEKSIPERELTECMEQRAKKGRYTAQLAELREQLDQEEAYDAEQTKQLKKAEKETELLYQQIKEASRKQDWQQRGEWLFLLLTVVGALLWALSAALPGTIGVIVKHAVRLLGWLVMLCGPAIGLPLILKNRNHGKKDLEDRLEAVQRMLRNEYERQKRHLPELEKKRFALEQAEERVKECERAEERYRELQKEADSLQKEVKAVSLARAALQEVSAQMNEAYGEAFYQKMSDYVKSFTDCKYERLTADEGLQLNAITEDGKITAGQVSRGTEEQFYLALRFAAADVFDPEKKNPMILDDSFAAFDEQRLESALLALSGCGRQIFLFSSTGREEKIVSRMGIAHKTIEGAYQ